MPLLPLCLGLILGIFSAFISGSHTDTLKILFISCFALSILGMFYSRLFNHLSVSKIATVSVFSFSFVLIGFYKLEWSGESISKPTDISEHVSFGTVFKTRISESGYQTIHLSLEKTVNGNSQVATKGKLILTLDTLEEIYHIGDYVVFKTAIDAFHNETNPGSFDAVYYYGTHHYIGRGFIASNCISRIGTKNNIGLFFSKWQDEMAEKIKSWLPESVAGIGVALLLGDKAGIDAEILDSFSNTGAMHVLAVSGLHVGIILLIFQYILSFFSRWISKRQALLFSVVLIWGFGLLSGASPSAD